MVLVFLATFAVVVGNVMPHHHHHGDETVVCFANDFPESEECCDHNHHATDGSCCGVKINLQAHFGDSRKHNASCDCCSTQHFCVGHLYFYISWLIPGWDSPAADKWPEKTSEYPPYSNLYHSIATSGHTGLRAPPVA